MRDQVSRAAALNPYNPVTANFYNVEEQVAAAYGMVRLGYDWGSVLAGARVEHITNTGQAIVALAGVNTRIEVGS